MLIGARVAGRRLQQELGDREVGSQPEARAQQRPIEQRARRPPVAVDKWVVVADHEVSEDRSHDWVDRVSVARGEVAETPHPFGQFFGGRRAMDDCPARRHDEDPRFPGLLETAGVCVAGERAAGDDLMQFEKMLKIDRFGIARPILDRLHCREVVGDHPLTMVAGRPAVAQHLARNHAAGIGAFQLTGPDRLVHQREVEAALSGAARDQRLVREDVFALR